MPLIPVLEQQRQVVGLCELKASLPAPREAEVGGLQAQGLSGKLGKTLSQNKKFTPPPKKSSAVESLPSMGSTSSTVKIK